MISAKKPSPIKQRRTRAEIRFLRDSFAAIVEKYKPMTVRQIYYQAVSRGLIDKTEAQYKGTIVRLLGDMRRDGQIPYDWIADNTRWMRKPDTHSSLWQMLARSSRFYRRSVWDNQDVYVEIWLEKEALAGVLVDVTDEWDVPLMVTRGFPSMSYLHQAGQVVANETRPVYLYYFGDHDPSGVQIPRVVERDIRGFAPDAEIHFDIVAVTRDQIAEYGLPTRPTKESDSRSKDFEGESVEVDAIEPDDLLRLCRECIEKHVDPWALTSMQRVEAAERETLETIVDQLGAA